MAVSVLCYTYFEHLSTAATTIIIQQLNNNNNYNYKHYKHQHSYNYNYYILYASICDETPYNIK